MKKRARRTKYQNQLVGLDYENLDLFEDSGSRISRLTNLASLSTCMFLSTYMCVCMWGGGLDVYLHEAPPSCGCVCQGHQLLLHLINPFFDPAGQTQPADTDLLLCGHFTGVFIVQLSCHCRV